MSEPAGQARRPLFVALLLAGSAALFLTALGVGALVWSGGIGWPAVGPTTAPAPTAMSAAVERDTPTRPPAPTSSASLVAAGANPTAVATVARAPLPAPGPSAAVQASPSSPAALLDEDPRVEQAMQGLATDADRVGQLLLLGWEGSTAETAGPMLRDLRPGGVVFIANAATQAEAAAINAGLWQLASEGGLLPPLLAIDHEGGPVQRIRDVPNLGSNLQFAQQGSGEREACERGRVHARQLRAIGFSMNLAPVLDVNNNPANPVIGVRSYGADPQLVAALGSAYARGLQGDGIVAVGKHFPGHGNTGVDSHTGLPVLPHAEPQLEQVELVPFRRAIEPPTDVAAIMSAHIAFPAVEPTGAPATLSRPIMTGLLRERLQFRGLAVSDDLGAMRAITDNFAPGEAAVRAVRAGVDFLIIGGDLSRQRASRDALLAALASGELARERLDEAVRRVVRTKARVGLLGDPGPVAGGC